VIPAWAARSNAAVGIRIANPAPGDVTGDHCLFGAGIQHEIGVDAVDLAAHVMRIDGAAHRDLTANVEVA